MDTPSSTVGPGIGAFIAFFLLALCLWLLMRNMNGRMRRMAYREQQRVADLEAREAAAQEQRAGQTSTTTRAPRTKRRKGRAGAPETAGSAPAEPGQRESGQREPGQTGPDDPTP